MPPTGNCFDAAYQRATQVLTENITLLHQVAAGLLERETLARDDIEILRRGEPLPPRSSGGSTPAPTPSPSPVIQTKPSAPPLLGGPEIAPA